MSSARNVNVVEMVDLPESGPTQAEFRGETSDPQKFYQLREHPFPDNVNPEYFFRTEAHEDAYIKMKRCIEDNISLGLITARSGTGKTLLTQILLQELDMNRFKPALVLAYPRISRSALLKELIQELEIEDITDHKPLHVLINIVQEKIYQLHREGKKPIFLIDEAHFLDGDTLHLLRTLSNIETAQKKLVTILLFGEESFLAKLDKPKYRAILSRMFIRAHLRPLLSSEVEQYVKFRCLMAGGKSDLFEADVFSLVHEATDGVPREINRLCHNALQYAAGKGINKIDRSMIRQVIRMYN
ncbi:AAA family ATPase [Candidatus Sumerlaeota bacterium]|nr:AAA family ATPase [Candidatus Sumerlaeota bacterium]